MTSFEYELIIKGLDHLLTDEYTRCKWEVQDYGQYGYTPNERVKEIKDLRQKVKELV